MTGKWIRRIALAASIAAAGCTSSVEIDGTTVPCIGAFDDPDPNYRYEAATVNIIMAVVFFETIVVPIVVLLDETRCPVAAK